MDTTPVLHLMCRTQKLSSSTAGQPPVVAQRRVCPRPRTAPAETPQFFCTSGPTPVSRQAGMSTSLTKNCTCESSTGSSTAQTIKPVVAPRA